jgi:hypothetical protein
MMAVVPLEHPILILKLLYPQFEGGHSRLHLCPLRPQEFSLPLELLLRLLRLRPYLLEFLLVQLLHLAE